MTAESRSTRADGPGIPRWLVARLPARVTRHLDTPLYRNGYALVLATGVTALLGFLYWALAAQKYSKQDVGLNSALIASMTFLANLAHLNLTNGLNRFVPTAGRRVGRLVGLSYVVAGGLAIVIALVYVGAIDFFSPELTDLVRDNPLAVGGFVLATALWVIFQLQDSVLTGFGRADWVLVENVTYGVIKIVALVALATALPDQGIFASWTLPLILLVVPVNLLVFRKLVPRQHADPEAHVEDIHVRDLGRFLTADFLASLLWTATTSLLPLVVLAMDGAAATAYFSIAWLVAYTLYLLSRNLGMSLVTEGARAPQRLYEFALRTLAQSAKIVIPLAVVTAVAAPLILRFFGTEYVDGASLLLALLALSAIPNVVITTFLSAARVQRRMKAVTIVTAAMSVSVMGFSVLLLDRYGLTGVGVAWLAAQSVIAILLLVTELRAVWLPRVPWHRLPRFSLTRSHAADAASAALVAAEGWDPAGEPRADGDLGAVVVRSRADGRLGVLRFARTPTGADGLRRHQAALASFARANLPASWYRTAPEILASNEAARRPWLVETHLTGVDAREVASIHGPDVIAARAGAAIRMLHEATARDTFVDETVLQGWVDDPIAELRSTGGTPLRAGADEAALDRLRDQLRDELGGRVLTTCFAHGDFWLGNVLASPDGTVTGLVDWERAGAPGLAALDVMTLVLTGQVEQRRRELGPVVRDLLRGDELAPWEHQLLAAGPGAGELAERTVLLLAWLHHAASNLQKRNSYRANTVWVTTNVHYVLEKM
jgi:O-antigen/teichoic acid export membrane protein/aminoglycoside phosphotransferase